VSVRVCVCVYVCVSVRKCVCACEYTSVRVCACVCVCAHGVYVRNTYFLHTFYIS